MRGWRPATGKCRGPKELRQSHNPCRQRGKSEFGSRDWLSKLYRPKRASVWQSSVWSILSSGYFEEATQAGYAGLTTLCGLRRCGGPEIFAEIPYFRVGLYRIGQSFPFKFRFGSFCLSMHAAVAALKPKSSFFRSRRISLWMARLHTEPIQHLLHLHARYLTSMAAWSRG